MKRSSTAKELGADLIVIGSHGYSERLCPATYLGVIPIWLRSRGDQSLHFRLYRILEIKPKVSPEEVKDKIEEALRRSAELDAGRIVVEVVGATVKLEGAVRSWAERSEAERAACSAPGTANVENHLSIKPY